MDAMERHLHGLGQPYGPEHGVEEGAVPRPRPKPVFVVPPVASVSPQAQGVISQAQYNYITAMSWQLAQQAQQMAALRLAQQQQRTRVGVEPASGGGIEEPVSVKKPLLYAYRQPASAREYAETMATRPGGPVSEARGNPWISKAEEERLYREEVARWEEYARRTYPEIYGQEMAGPLPRAETIDVGPVPSALVNLPPVVTAEETGIFSIAPPAAVSAFRPEPSAPAPKPRPVQEPSLWQQITSSLRETREAVRSAVDYPPAITEAEFAVYLKGKEIKPSEVKAVLKGFMKSFVAYNVLPAAVLDGVSDYLGKDVARAMEDEMWTIGAVAFFNAVGDMEVSLRQPEYEPKYETRTGPKHDYLVKRLWRYMGPVLNNVYGKSVQMLVAEAARRRAVGIQLATQGPGRLQGLGFLAQPTGREAEIREQLAQRTQIQTVLVSPEYAGGEVGRTLPVTVPGGALPALRVVVPQTSPQDMRIRARAAAYARYGRVIPAYSGFIEEAAVGAVERTGSLEQADSAAGIAYLQALVDDQRRQALFWIQAIGGYFGPAIAQATSHFTPSIAAGGY